MHELVKTINGEALTDTLIIAEGAQNSHKAVIQLVRSYISDFEEVGQRVAFEMRPFETSGGIQKREIALLNEPQAALLFTFMKNSDIVRAFKVRLVKAFYAMRQLAPTASGDAIRQIIREELSNFTPQRKAALPVSKEEAALFKADILAGLGTAETARKHGRAKSTIMSHTIVERKTVVRRAN